MLVGCQFEHGRHEVLGARVLFKPPNQVGDCCGEFGWLNHRRVQQYRANILRHDGSLGARHPEKHLKLHPAGHRALLGEKPRERDVEQVVAGHADAHGIRALQGERPAEHALVVGVGLEFACNCGQRPAVLDGIHPFHGEVRALHKAHLDSRSTASPAGGSPRGQPLQRVQRVRQVGLQNNPGLQVFGGRLVEQPLEHVDGEVEVVELLHIEVDELRRSGGRSLLIQWGQPGDNPLDRLVVRPHRQLSRHGRHLDRDIVDIVTGEQFAGIGEPTVGLAHTQYGFAEQIQVEPNAPLAQLCDVLVELLRSRVEHQVADHAAEYSAGDRNDWPRQERGEPSAELDREPHVPGKEGGNSTGNLLEIASGDAEVRRANHAVDEANGEVESVRVFQQSREPLGRDILLRRCVRGVCACRKPAAHGCDGLIRQILRARVERRNHGGRRHSSNYERLRASRCLEATGTVTP